MGSRSDGEHTTYSLSVTPHTDKEGVFWFPEVAPGSYCLKVNVPGFPPQPDLQFEVAPREDKEVNIVLPGVGGLEGRAIHADGETPFAGVYVVAVPVGESLDVRYETRGQAGKGLETRYPWSTTDVNGRYTLERLGEGLYTLWLVGEGKPLPNLWEMSEGQPLAVRERVRVRPDQVLGGLDLRAWQEPEAEPPPGIIAGRITLPDGTPAAALRFHYRLLTEKGEQELRWPWITPEADGRYRLADVPPGRYDLVIFTPGYLQGEARGLVVEPGQTCADADVRLPRPATLRLRVVDPQGQPVAGAKMFYEREGAKVELRDGGSRSVRGFRDGPATNAEGLLELAEILPGRYRVVVKPESWASQLKTLEVHDGETVEEALTVSSGATLRGTVARPDGTPLAKARVTASLENDPTEHMLTGWAQTDEAGHFTLHVQAPGTYRLSAWAQDHHSVRGEPLGVAEGQAVDDWAFRLAPHEIGALAVQVVAPDGETPVAGAMVGFSPYFIETTPTTDKEGRVDLKQVLLSDDNVLTVYHPDFAVTRVKHPPLQANATTPLKVQMSRGGAIVGTVRPAAGPPGGFLVVAGATETDPTTYHPGDYGSRVPSFFSAVTQPDGSYRIDQLAPGTYTVFLYRGEVGPRVDGVSVADGQTTESVDLTLANARP
jgi:protocatechuate 3,4-dioxygenase beta subunit